MPGRYPTSILFLLLLLLVILTSTIPAKAQNSSKAVVIVFPDGWMDITLMLNLTGNESLVNVRIEGEPHYLLVEGEGWLLLNHTLSGNTLSIETLGAKQINISYQTPSLTTKIGSLWNASIDLNVSSVTLLLPKDSVVLGMSSVPYSIQVKDQWMEFSFDSGSIWVTYKIERAPITSSTSATSKPKGSESIAGESLVPSSRESGVDLSITTSSTGINSTVTNGSINVKNSGINSYLIFISLIAAILTISIFSLMKKHKAAKISESDLDSLERDIISELLRRGGQALQSDLVKALDAPRATIWRRLRRMESEGKVELVKEGRYTLVKLKVNLDDSN